MKLRKLLWGMYIFMLAGTFFTKFLLPNVEIFFSISLTIVSSDLYIKGTKDLIDMHKEKKNKKTWLSEHMSIIPESREVVLTVNSQLEKWEEDLISKINKAASEEGLKVTINSPLSEVIDNYYS